MTETDFQVRHVRLGVFQGRTCCGFAWYPSNPVPEIGFQRFETHVDAEAFVAAVCELNPEARPEDFIVEPFQLATHCEIVRCDLTRARIRRMIRGHFASVERQRRRV